MRPGFGPGVSIPSQLRWVNYVDTWTRTGKVYVERPVQILEVHAWGLRDGVKVAVEGYTEEGRKIKTIHTFTKHERLIVDSSDNPANNSTNSSSTSHLSNLTSPNGSLKSLAKPTVNPSSPSLDHSTIKHTISDGSPLIEDSTSQPLTPSSKVDRAGSEIGGKAVIFRPSAPILVPTSDVCIDLERRNRAPYGWTMVTSVAHVWFNVFFEGLPPAHMVQGDVAAQASDRGVFEIEWDAMDGIKGSSKKGTRALEKLAVVWRVPKGSPGSTAAAAGPEAVANGAALAQVITQPGPGEAVPEAKAADWKGGDAEDGTKEDKKLGMRVRSARSRDVSRASTVRGSETGDEGEEAGADKRVGKDYEEEMAKVKTHGLEEGEEKG